MQLPALFEALLASPSLRRSAFMEEAQASSCLLTSLLTNSSHTLTCSSRILTLSSRSVD